MDDCRHYSIESELDSELVHTYLNLAIVQGWPSHESNINEDEQNKMEILISDLSHLKGFYSADDYCSTRRAQSINFYVVFLWKKIQWYKIQKLHVISQGNHPRWHLPFSFIHISFS